MYGCFHNQYTTPPSPKTIWDVDIMLFLFRNRIHICYKVYKVTQFVPCVNVYPYYGNMFLSIMLSLLSKVCIYNWLRHLVDNINIMDTLCFTQMYKKNFLSSQFSFLYSFLLFLKYFFSGWPLSVLRGHSFFIPATTANDLRLRRIFYPRIYPLHLFSYLNSWERASISLFNVQC